MKKSKNPGELECCGDSEWFIVSVVLTKTQTENKILRQFGSGELQIYDDETGQRVAELQESLCREAHDIKTRSRTR